MNKNAKTNKQTESSSPACIKNLLMTIRLILSIDALIYFFWKGFNIQSSIFPESFLWHLLPLISLIFLHDISISQYLKLKVIASHFIPYNNWTSSHINLFPFLLTPSSNGLQKYPCNRILPTQTLVILLHALFNLLEQDFPQWQKCSNSCTIQCGSH